jgi:hypothetical protein
LSLRSSYELKQYLETNAAQLDPDTYDNINWRGGIRSLKAISDEYLAEIIEYIPAEKLQELIELASSKTAM